MQRRSPVLTGMLILSAGGRRPPNLPTSSVSVTVPGADGPVYTTDAPNTTPAVKAGEIPNISMTGVPATGLSVTIR